jgi:hypothetical protein
MNPERGRVDLLADIAEIIYIKIREPMKSLSSP